MSGPVEDIVARVLHLPAEHVTDETAMQDVEAWDSLKHMELILAIEEGFGLELTFDEIIGMQSVGEIKRLLGQRGLAV